MSDTKAEPAKPVRAARTRTRKAADTPAEEPRPVAVAADDDGFAAGIVDEPAPVRAKEPAPAPVQEAAPPEPPEPGAAPLAHAPDADPPDAARQTR